MTKLSLIAVVAVSMLGAACGGRTKTITVTMSPRGPLAIQPVGPTGLGPSAFGAGLTAAGVHSKRTIPAGPGTEVYAITQDGAVVGAIKGPNSAVARDIARSFSRGGYTTKPVKKDPTAYAIYKGRLSRADSVLLSECTR